MGKAGLGDSLENRHGAAKLAPRDKRLAGDAAPAGNRGVLSLKAYPGVARMARLSPPAGSQASLRMQTSLAEPYIPSPSECCS